MYTLFKIIYFGLLAILTFGIIFFISNNVEEHRSWRKCYYVVLGLNELGCWLLFGITLEISIHFATFSFWCLLLVIIQFIFLEIIYYKLHHGKLLRIFNFL